MNPLVLSPVAPKTAPFGALIAVPVVLAVNEEMLSALLVAMSAPVACRYTRFADASTPRSVLIPPLGNRSGAPPVPPMIISDGPVIGFAIDPGCVIVFQ